MKNILVPCDFSRPAEEAFKFAVKIASQSHGAIHVLYVIDITFLRGNPTLSHSYAFNLNFLTEIEKEVEQKFQILRGRYAPFAMEVKFKHIISSLNAEVENYVKVNNIDLVLIGTHGEGNSAFGSNAEKIVRNSTVPVISVRTAPGQVRNIVFPLIPGQGRKPFVEAVKDLQAFFDARIYLLYINTPLFFRNDNDSQKELAQFAQDNNFSNFDAVVRSDYSLEDGVRHFVNEVHADMVALGTHGWKGLTHLFIGSAAEDVVNHFKIPVWTRHLD